MAKYEIRAEASNVVEYKGLTLGEGGRAMRRMIMVREMDQPVVPPMLLADYVPPTDLLRRLVEAAMVSGDATGEDQDGCPVTVLIYQAD